MVNNRSTDCGVHTASGIRLGATSNGLHVWVPDKAIINNIIKWGVPAVTLIVIPNGIEPLIHKMIMVGGPDKRWIDVPNGTEHFDNERLVCGAPDVHQSMGLMKKTAEMAACIIERW